MIKTRSHPECRQGEVYLTDVNTSGNLQLLEFNLIKEDWKTARLGLHTFEKDIIIVGKRPVFIEFDEMISKVPVSP